MEVDKVTPEQLAEIEAKVEEAAAGPWMCEWYEGKTYLMQQNRVVLASFTIMSDKDCNFCAHARTDIPALIAEVKRLTAERNELGVEVVKLRSAIQIMEVLQERDPVYDEYRAINPQFDEYLRSQGR